MKPPFHIVVICWGSSCRSPMAKALLDAELEAAGVTISVEARALHTPATGASAEAVDAMRARGLDISTHVPRRLSDSDVEQADLLLVMDRELLRDASVRWPDAASKMSRIMEYATGEPSDVKDPIGDIAEYEMAAKRLGKAAIGIAKRLAQSRTAEG